MNPGALVSLVASFGLVALSYWMLPWLVRKRRARDAKPEPPASVLDRAELCTLQGAWQAAADLAAPVLAGTAAAARDTQV